jgi:hypothetical protein
MLCVGIFMSSDQDYIRAGVEMMNDRCKEMVWDSSGFHKYRCSRRGKIDGYCKQHHPDIVAERKRKREAAAEAKWQNSPHKKLERAYEKIDRLQARVKELETELASSIALTPDVIDRLW